MSMTSRRVGIVGAGAVGATAAYTLAIMGTCNEIILYDISAGVAKGKAIDIEQATSHSDRGVTVSAADAPSDMKDCDIVVVTAGVPRKGDMTRADLLNINAKIIAEVTNNIKTYSPNAIIICVSNPLDVMTYVMHKLTGWDRNRIIGMAGALDGARMSYQIQKKVGYGSGQIKSLVIGDHGEHMIPYPAISTVGGIPLPQLIGETDMDEISQKTKVGGAEIVSHLKTSGFYAPGRSVAVMVEAILNDSKAVISSSVLLDGEYGYKGVTLGVPVVLGANGAEKIIELELDEKMKGKIETSVKSIQENIKILEDEGFFS